MAEIKNLVFEGGGVLGMAYAGAIETLHEEGKLEGIKNVAGTSAGSLIALILSLGYSSSELGNIVNSTNFKAFEDHWDPLRIVTKYGVYKGEFLLKYIQKIVSDKTGSPDTTFEELHHMNCLGLKVYACNLNTQSIKEFSYELTPTVKVAESVRASMSIPLFFSAWQFPDGNPDLHIYVDGGTVYNYPINAFNDLENTLGFFFKKPEGVVESNLKYDNIMKYVESVFHSLLNAQKVNFNANTSEVKKTVFIDTHGISATEFKLTDDQKTLLYNAGKEATKEYLKVIN